MKKLLFLFLPLLFLTGCDSYTELNELGIINALGITYQEDSFSLTSSFVNAKKEEQEVTEEVTTYQSTGSSIEEAFHNLYLQSSKKIYLSHLQLVVLSKEVATDKMKDILSFFIQNEESRNNFPVIITDDVSAFLSDSQTVSDCEKLLYINQQEYGSISSPTLEDIARQLYENGVTVVPHIIKKEHLQTDGYIVFRDFKAMGKLDDTLSNTYLLLHNQIQKMNIPIQCENETMQLEVKESMTTIQTEKDTILIKVTSQLENMETNCDLVALYQDAIHSRIEDLLQYTKENDVDLMHFTPRFEKNNPFYFKKQQPKFQNANYKIEISAKLTDHQKLQGGAM